MLAGHIVISDSRKLKKNIYSDDLQWHNVDIKLYENPSRGTFLSTATSSPVLGSPARIQRLSRAPSQGEKRPDREAVHSILFYVKDKSCVSTQPFTFVE